MKFVILYLGILFIGYFIASRLRPYANKFNFLGVILMTAVYILVFIMGLRMGVNEQVTSNLGTIGLKALVMTVFCCGGSMLTIFMTRKLFKMDRYGDLTGRENEMIDGQPDITEGTGEGSTLNLSSTLIILAVVIFGMLIGFFLLAPYAPASVLLQFDEISADLLIIFLCILLFLVGFELGLSGKVASSIRNAGFRVLAFPIAAIFGTLIFGAAAGLLLGFSLKEGLAISAGFGWYTYAPTIISDAGSEYMIAGAVSFMHNIIRETSGIVLIPVLAKRFGYIEVTSLPGVAASDICIPIVEKACRQDTIVYSFTIGISMSVAASVLVPVFMSM